MTGRDDPRTEAIFKALRDIEGIDDKLMGRPEVAHLPSVLGEDELPGAIVVQYRQCPLGCYGPESLTHRAVVAERLNQ